MSTRIAPDRFDADAHESTGQVVAGTPISVKVLGGVVIAAILTSLIGLGLTVSGGTTLDTMSGAATAFGVLGALGMLAAVVMGIVALIRDN